MLQQRLVRYRARFGWSDHRAKLFYKLTIALEIYERRSMQFQFRLESVLKLRQHERERQRQSVTLARQKHAEYTAKRDDITQSRLAVIKELRQMNRDDVWVVDQVNLRQNHIEILNQDLLNVEADIARADSHLAECLKRLISADQAACALERLAELQRAEFHKNEARIEARNFDDLARPDRRVA